MCAFTQPDTTNGPFTGTRISIDHAAQVEMRSEATSFAMLQFESQKEGTFKKPPIRGL